MNAATQGHVHVMKWLVEEGGGNLDDELYGNHLTAIMLACTGNHLPVVRWLVENQFRDKNGALLLEHADVSGNSCLHIAATHGHLDLLAYLVDQCHVSPATGNAYDEHALFLAAQNDHADVVRWLLDKGGMLGKVHSTSISGYTPLAAAGFAGAAAGAAVLVRVGRAVPDADTVETLFSFARRRMSRRLGRSRYDDVLVEMLVPFYDVTRVLPTLDTDGHDTHREAVIAAACTARLPLAAQRLRALLRLVTAEMFSLVDIIALSAPSHDAAYADVRAFVDITHALPVELQMAVCAQAARAHLHSLVSQGLDAPGGSKAPAAAFGQAPPNEVTVPAAEVVDPINLVDGEGGLVDGGPPPAVAAYAEAEVEGDDAGNAIPPAEALPIPLLLQALQQGGGQQFEEIAATIAHAFAIGAPVNDLMAVLDGAVGGPFGPMRAEGAARDASHGRPLTGWLFEHSWKLLSLLPSFDDRLRAALAQFVLTTPLHYPPQWMCDMYTRAGTRARSAASTTSRPVDQATNRPVDQTTEPATDRTANTTNVDASHVGSRRPCTLS